MDKSILVCLLASSVIALVFIGASAGNVPARKGTVLVYFFLPSCSHCKDFNGTFFQRMQDNGGRYEMVDVSKFPERARSLDVTSVPTVIRMNESGAVLSRWSTGRESFGEFLYG